MFNVVQLNSPFFFFFLKATESITEEPAVSIRIKKWGRAIYHMKTFNETPIRPEYDYNLDQMNIS